MRSYFRRFTTIIRLIKHLIDPSRYQSIDRFQSINHSIDRSKERSLNQTITRSVLIDHSNFRSINHSINQLINQSIIDQSVYRSTERSIAIEQSIDRLIDQSINQSILCSIISSCFVRIEILTFFQNLGADSTDPADTTRTATVIDAYETNCNGYNGYIRKTCPQRPLHQCVLV